MLAEQPKKVDPLVDSNMHGVDSINIAHDAHEEEKDHNLWHMTKAMSKSINGQGLSMHISLTNSSIYGILNS